MLEPPCWRNHPLPLLSPSRELIDKSISDFVAHLVLIMYRKFVLWLDTVRCVYRDYKFVKYHNFDPNLLKFFMAISKDLINFLT